MKGLTFILPLHKYDDDVKSHLTIALESIKKLEGAEKAKVSVVGPSDVLSKVEELYKQVNCPQTLKLIENNDINMFVQINKGVMGCTTKYFSIFEFDDYYNPFWLKSVDKYIDAKDESSAFIPLNRVVIDGKEGLLMNEIVWASSFSEEMGVIDLKSLETFMDYNLTGAIFKTEDFISVGGLKPSLEISSWYEFLMRMCYNAKRLFVVPRVGYCHTLGLEGSYMKMNGNIEQKKAMWLINTARQEYFFKEDRNKKYEDENNGDKD